MSFGTWNIMSLCRAGSVTAAARELAIHKLDLVDMQEVRWDKGGTVRVGDYNFSMEKETKIINWEQDFFVHHRIISAVKTAEFVSDRVSYIVMRGRWCNTVVLNVHARSEDKIDASKDSFYVELKQVF